MRKFLVVPAVVVALSSAGGPAFACGGLIGPNGAVNLLRTSTFAGYHGGVEHYVTSFKFAGGGGAFGSLTPLPGVPSKVERGGDWTLQRLVRETAPVLEAARSALTADLSGAGRDAEELLKVRVDALDITVLKGGAQAIGTWAEQHGFRLPPDAPEVLDFYAKRSPIFLAAAFDADAAKQRGQNVGDGTPVHVTIPTTNPWVPLRILGLGKQASEIVEADVYLLTDRKPALLSTRPVGAAPGTLQVVYDQAASTSLLTDLNADKGMDWIPTDRAWLTKLAVNGPAADVTGDLAIDVSGQGAPSRVAAGFLGDLAAALPPLPRDGGSGSTRTAALVLGAALAGLLLAAALGRRTAP